MFRWLVNYLEPQRIKRSSRRITEEEFQILSPVLVEYKNKLIEAYIVAMTQTRIKVYINDFNIPWILKEEAQNIKKEND